MFGVISNFNSDPRYLKDYFSKILIFDQSPRKALWTDDLTEDELRISHHVGHNILDYLNFVIQHHDSLPTRMILGKGNMIPRHITGPELQSIILAKPDFSPVWTSSDFPSGRSTAWVDKQGYLNELNNDWFVSKKNHPRFTKTNDLANFLFSNWANPDFLSFSPGAMYAISKGVLESADLSTFVCLAELLERNFFPSEAWMVERLLPGVLSGTLKLRQEWSNHDAFVRALDSHQDASRSFVAPPGPMQKTRQGLALLIPRKG